MEAIVCPKGHQSTEPDYCSECGAKIVANGAEGRSSGSQPFGGNAAAPELCPKCGTAREDLSIPFCEVCGYNFVTSTGGAPTPEPPPAEPAPVSAASHTAASWTVTVTVDSALREPGSPEAPAGVGPFTFTVNAPASLIGRKSEARAIFPEIPLSYDDAVSHRHALLQLDAQGALLLRDIGSSNGTRLNGTEIPAMVDHPLRAGDEITLGHWSRIRIEAVE
jgi:ribosomal protein L37AE/L43A